eukprot:Nk52_evm35s152 gene=Nk52_evmTU35s152
MESNSNVTSTAFHLARDLVTGGTSATLLRTALAPLERIRIILQVQDASHQISYSNKNIRYGGMLGCLWRIPREQGVAAFWRGNIPGILTYFPTHVVSFVSNGWLRGLFLPPNTTYRHDWGRYMCGQLLVGGMAGVLALPIVYPLGFARTRMAADMGSNRKGGNRRLFSGMFNCIRTVVIYDGLKGLYRGMLPSICWIFVHRAIHLGGFQIVKESSYWKAIRQRSKSQHRTDFIWRMREIGEVLVMAHGVTTLAGLVAYPLDTVSRRLMLQSAVKNPIYNGMRECIAHTFRHEGLRGFLKGSHVEILRSTSGALMLVLFDRMILTHRS